MSPKGASPKASRLKCRKFPELWDWTQRWYGYRYAADFWAVEAPIGIRDSLLDQLTGSKSPGLALNNAPANAHAVEGSPTRVLGTDSADLLGPRADCLLDPREQPDELFARRLGLVDAVARHTDQVGDLVTVGGLHPVDPLL